MNVDDLLIEQIALQQQQAFGAGEGAPVGRSVDTRRSLSMQTDGVDGTMRSPFRVR